MKWLGIIKGFLDGWTRNVAGAIISGLERVISPRVIRLTEEQDGGFTAATDATPAAPPSPVQFVDGVLTAPNLSPLLKGSRIEIVLQPRRFVFRPLEVPTRAVDFMEGIVRAQIDRLTPWSAADAVFGCSKPVHSGTETVTSIVAATTRKVAMSCVNAVAGFHPTAIAILTEVAGYDAGRVKVFEQKARGYLDAARLSRLLLIVFALSGVLAATAVAAAVWATDYLGGEEEELAQQITQRRAAIRAASDGARSPVTALERRKQQTPASVVVLDALTRALPDNSYVTEFHLADNKVQIVGVTADAAPLISLIEQSAQFNRATFYAPTTRSASDPGERFHIEAQLGNKTAVKP